MLSKTRRFGELGLHGKTVYLNRHGKYLASRKFQNFEVHLYQCYHFYVEVWMRKGSLHHLQWIVLTTSPQVCDNYLGRIDLQKDLSH